MINDVVNRVPEDKCHMVLPEIEEEYEYEDGDGQKLSLTSLLLGRYLIALVELSLNP